MNKIFVSVIIPTRNRRASVIRTIRSVLRQSYPESSYEILVCCDRCEDGTEEAVQTSFGRRVQVVQVPRARAGSIQEHSRNTGLHAAKGELALFLDDDTEAEAGFVAAHANAHVNGSCEKLVVSGAMSVAQRSDASAFEREQASQMSRQLQALPQDGIRGRSPLLMFGGNFSMRTDLMRQMGGFNDSYGFPRDDLEFGLRLAQAGFMFEYCPAAVVTLWIEMDPEQLIGRAAQRARNDYRLALDYPDSLPYLPFYASLRRPASRIRWSLLWRSRGAATVLVKSLRSIASDNLRLINLEYAMRYCDSLRMAVGSWKSLVQLCEREVSVPPISPSAPTHEAAPGRLGA